MYKYGVLFNLQEIEIPETHLNTLKSSVENLVTVNSDDPEVLTKLKDADLVLVNYTDFTTEMINAVPNLKYIGAISTAFEYIDLKTASEKGITVTNLGAYSKEAVAEFIFAGILAEFRELKKANVQATNKTFDYKPFMGSELKGKTIGVLGAGRIGSRVCEIALGFSMNVNYFARSEKTELETIGIKLKTLEEIFKDSDIIAITLPIDETTSGIIDSNLLSQLKDKCLIVSVAAPEIFKEEDLITDLKNNTGHVYVTDQAEEFKAEILEKYSSLDNVTLYPNLAFRTAEANDARWRILVENVRDSLNGIKNNVVN